MVYVTALQRTDNDRFSKVREEAEGILMLVAGVANDVPTTNNFSNLYTVYQDI